MGTGKIIAALIALACIAGLFFLNKQTFGEAPKPEQAQTSENPKFAKCRADRIAAVEKMRDDGMIDDAKFTEFSTRAISFCASQFPPESGG